MTRQELFIWIRQQYGTEPEYPWHDWNAVLRHNDNNKWYGVVLEVSADKLGLPEAGIVDVLNVKSDPLLIGSLRGQDGYFPAYHMNKEKWLSIQLGKPELDDAIKDLLSLSYELTAPKKRKPKSSAKNPGDSANGKENDRKGKQWLLTYTGSPKKMNKHYRERFHVDAVTAAKDLQELGSIIHRSSSGNNCADGICTICNKKEEPVKAPRRYVISKSCSYVPVHADYSQV